MIRASAPEADNVVRRIIVEIKNVTIRPDGVPEKCPITGRKKLSRIP